MTSYTTGTVSVTNGDAAISGAGTLWQNAIIEGDLFGLSLAGPFYEVTAVGGDTAITLDRPYQEVTAAAQSYVIVRLSLSRQTTTFVANRVQSLIDSFRSVLSVSGDDKIATLDKATTGNSALFRYRAGGAERWRHGTIGDDEFKLQRSGDGVAFLDVMTVARATGAVALAGALSVAGAVAAETLDVSGDVTLDAALNVGGDLSIVGALSFSGGLSEGLAITNDLPFLDLIEPDAPATHRQLRFFSGGGNILFQTRDSVGDFVSDDYRMNRNAAGATQHIFSIGNAVRATVDSAGVSVAGQLSATGVSAGASTFTGNVTLNDNVFLRVGSGGDLTFRHDGTNSLFQSNTGAFLIDSEAWGQDITFRARDSGGTRHTMLQLNNGATIVSPVTVANTTANGANLHMDGGGTLFYSTSVAAAKRELAGDHFGAMLAAVMGARPILFNSTLQADDPSKIHWGLIAEEVAALQPALAHWSHGEYVERTVDGLDQDGAPFETKVRVFEPYDTPRPSGVQYERFAVPLIAVAQHHQRAIERLALAVGAIVDPLGEIATAAHVSVERDERLAAGFDFDFADERGVHRIGTTPADRKGWDEVTTGAQAAIALGEPDTAFDIVTDTGPVTVTALEWMEILKAATEFRQPIWQASFALQAISPVPDDFASNTYWPQ